MSYDLIDKIIEKQRNDLENKRIQTLSCLKEVLVELAPKYGFSKAYIFGSIVKEGRFRSKSDVDIAVFDLENENFFHLMSDIYNLLGREVDLCQMEKIDKYFRKRIEETGTLWKKEN
jgi:uncharacterized protein